MLPETDRPGNNGKGQTDMTTALMAMTVARMVKKSPNGLGNLRFQEYLSFIPSFYTPLHDLATRLPEKLLNSIKFYRIFHWKSEKTEIIFPCNPPSIPLKQDCGIPPQYREVIGKEKDADNNKEYAGNDLENPDVLFKAVK